MQPLARILSVQMQDNKPVFWAECDPDPDMPMVDREFFMAETGNTHPHTAKYYGTVQLSAGIVAHLMEA